ncbi:acyltransferase family protein [Tumebacillus flagellatus]|uniref:Acyltransferase n=1 Tax=Tumebacillus flagellatus TaxID=1157490 RepID=A0A074LVY9_9BACL|nr:acyltransferase family protein [Tumebacillus flagellatus]KEO84730.1 acyltransferase [Tumebacillus flagellatus]
MPEREKHHGRYMAGLDGLRALAVLAVIAYHLHISWAPGGLLGVGVFFVLSGYLITDILAAQWERLGTIRLQDFWLRRIRRLLPAMLMMLAGVAFWEMSVVEVRPPSLPGDVLASVLYINNWWLVFHHVSYFESFGPPSPLGHLWSLAVEEQFYLLWPFAVLLLFRFTRKTSWRVGIILLGAAASALAMALLYEPGTDPSRVYYGTDTRAFALLIGAALALLWPSAKLRADISSKARRALDATGGAGLIAVLLMVWLTNQYQDFLYRGGFAVLSVATALTVAMLAHPASRLAKVLGWTPLKWLGVRSYGLYLWHYPVIVLSTPTVDAESFDLTRAFWQLAATLIISGLSYQFIEKPIRYRAAGCNRTVVASCAAVALGVTCLVFAMPATHTAAYSVVPTQPQTETQTHIETEPQTQTEEIPQVPFGPPIPTPAANTCRGITALGDSVMLDAEPYLQDMLPGIVVDAKIGRQTAQMPEVVEKLKAQGKLGSCIILSTGTNGPFTKEQLKSLLQSFGQADQIILVNTRVPRPWQNTVNEMLREAAASTPHTTLVDWYKSSAGKESFFYPDGVHLNPEGSKYYASLLVNEIKFDD